MYWATVSALILPMMRANRPSVCLVPEDAAIVIQRLDVVEIMQVVDACLREVVGMHYAAQSGEGVELVAEVIHTLRGAVAEVRRRVGSGSAHLATFSSTKSLKICNMYNFFFIYLSTIRLLFNSANGLSLICMYNSPLCAYRFCSPFAHLLFPFCLGIW